MNNELPEQENKTEVPAGEKFAKWVFIIVGLVMFIAFVTGLFNNRKSRYEPPVVDTHTLQYLVTGSSDAASITYRNAQGGTEQFSVAQLPWSHKESFVLEKRGYKSFYISAQNENRSGSVVVTIYIDGKEVKTSESVGEFVIASASHSYP